MLVAPTDLTDAEQTFEARASAVSGGAVLAGAIVSVAVTVIMLAAGAGFGLAAVSPWVGAGVSAATFTIGAGIWLIVVQWIASGVGGYITGRLRTRWAGIHTHEAFFRDTAHGFLTWSVATLIGAGLLAAAAVSTQRTAVNAAASVASSAAQATAGSMAADLSMERSYDVDGLFRKTTLEAGPSAPESNAEAGRILAVGIAHGDLSASDRAYLAQLVSARTGISPADAQKRVDDVISREQAAVAKVKQVADTARKSTAAFFIFGSLSMLIGAFIACVAAAFGGHLRDERR
jgi:hypothetical protein